MAASANRSDYHGVIERIVDHPAQTRSFFIRLPKERALGFIPGQFISLVLPLGDKPALRPYSIASDPEHGDLLEIVLNLVPGGLGSAYLFARRVGEELTFTGPYGLFTLEHAPTVETVFVAQETTIAPIRPMIRRALAEEGSAGLHLLYAAPREQNLLYREELMALARRHPRLRFDPVITQEPSWPGMRGPLREHLRALYLDADDRRDRQFYLCGVGPEVLTMRDLLRQNGYARKAVQYEKW
ncbi:MAG TPA: FAD-dependent oxidoreductase [Candidatus Binataceae bacterium]|nr:FAD-dependent oxidoreductase [Candidatus Binataceae bacterium]